MTEAEVETFTDYLAHKVANTHMGTDGTPEELRAIISLVVVDTMLVLDADNDLTIENWNPAR